MWQKVELYHQLDSLQEQILVSPGEALIERFSRQENGALLLTVFKGLEADLEVQAVETNLPLSEIYEDVKLGPEEVLNSTSRPK